MGSSRPAGWSSWGGQRDLGSGRGRLKANFTYSRKTICAVIPRCKTVLKLVLLNNDYCAILLPKKDGIRQNRLENGAEV